MDEEGYKKKLEICRLALEESNEKCNSVVMENTKLNADLSSAKARILNMEICEACLD